MFEIISMIRCDAMRCIAIRFHSIRFQNPLPIRICGEQNKAQKQMGKIEEKKDCLCFCYLFVKFANEENKCNFWFDSWKQKSKAEKRKENRKRSQNEWCLHFCSNCCLNYYLKKKKTNIIVFGTGHVKLKSKLKTGESKPKENWKSRKNWTWIWCGFVWAFRMKMYVCKTEKWLVFFFQYR